MHSDWQNRCKAIHEQYLRRAQAKGNLTTEDEIIRFLTLAICGEAGELANLIKKTWRADIVDPSEIQNEIADIRIYLEHLARHLHINLDNACERKLDLLAQRLKNAEGDAKTLEY